MPARLLKGGGRPLGDAEGLRMGQAGQGRGRHTAPSGCGAGGQEERERAGGGREGGGH